MPELAEVEFYRRRWWEAAANQAVRAAAANPRSRVYRSLAKEFSGGAVKLAKILPGAQLTDSRAHGKQMAFVLKLGNGREAQSLWLGIHLGMSGELRVEPPAYLSQKHDALVLRFARCALVFNDPRQFGRVRAWLGAGGASAPWLRKLPAEILAPEFTAEWVRGVLQRHARAPLKAVLLDQRYFFGIGNWMADEILWRAALHPALPSGRAADPASAKKLHRTVQKVARDALRVIAGQGAELPRDLNEHIPNGWLFNHRWADGGRCPKTQKPLRRAEIGGRTTCWSPARQKL
jgi:formamidopyrimidine-DNA glycosylase